MALTPEQETIGKENFAGAVNVMMNEKTDDAEKVTRREAMKAAAAVGTGLGVAYFGYKELTGGSRVKVAFIGTGDEGSILMTQHPENYMEVVAIADLRPSNRERAFKGDDNDDRIGLVRKLGADVAKNIRIFGSHKELLAHKDELGLEAVVIATPLVTHEPIALDCLDAGLHVLTEKLMARTITACKNMIRKAKEKNLLLAVGHQRHYSVLYHNANSLVQSGMLGDIKYIRAQWHRNNSFPAGDSWRKGEKAEEKADIDALKSTDLTEFKFKDANQLINWRLYNSTGGGLMAELGSHQMDAASIFLGKVHPLAVHGYGGKNFYGIEGVGPEDKWVDDREIDDHIYVTFEFPGPHYEKNNRDKCIVTYSSINTNKFEPYGEIVYGSRGTLFMKTEKEAMLWKEEGRGSAGGGPDQRLWVITGSAAGGGAAMEAYETNSGPKAAGGGPDWASNVSRGYREEMEHFAYAIRNHGPDYWPGGKPRPLAEGGLRCNGVVAMADAIMALTANLAMETGKRIAFKDEWFDPDSDACPETDTQVMG